MWLHETPPHETKRHKKARYDAGFWMLQNFLKLVFGAAAGTCLQFYLFDFHIFNKEQRNTVLHTVLLKRKVTLFYLTNLRPQILFNQSYFV